MKLDTRTTCVSSFNLTITNKTYRSTWIVLYCQSVENKLSRAFFNVISITPDICRRSIGNRTNLAVSYYTYCPYRLSGQCLLVHPDELAELGFCHNGTVTILLLDFSMIQAIFFAYNPNCQKIYETQQNHGLAILASNL